jgi:hypothetical protein
MLNDLDGSKSHRNGLCKVLGRDDLDWRDGQPPDYGADGFAWLEAEAKALLTEAQARAADTDYVRDVTFLTMESAFCTYKSWHRPNRRYPNVYNDMLHDRIRLAERRWPEEDFSVFWDIRRESLPAHLRLEDNPWDVGVKPPKQNHYLTTGQVIMMDREWPCFANDYAQRVDA